VYNLLAILLGSLIGLTAAIPGLHTSVLLVGLLPILGIGGDFGACLVTSAMASAVVASSLSKTFHPATRKTLNQATPEQAMTYRGEGLKAIDIQLTGIWTGLLFVLLAVTPLALAQFVFPDAPKFVFTHFVQPVAPVVMLAYIVSVIWPAHNKLATIGVAFAGSIIGYIGLNHPALTQSSDAALGPLLAGVFSIPPLVMVLTHRGRLAPIPHQRPAPAPTDLEVWPGLGAVAGMLTAVTAGIGSGAVVSAFAGQIPEDQYLSMHTASEAANNGFAILLFVLIGAAHSGSAVAIQRAQSAPDPWLAFLLIACIIAGVLISTLVTQKGVGPYVLLVAKIPQRATAAGVLALTLGLVAHEAGAMGLGVAALAALLGLIARAQSVPNQALASVLTGPILIYQLGLSPSLASSLGLLH